MRPKLPEEIEAMREGGRILAEVLELLRKQTVAGITTAELDAIAAKELERRGAKPPFLGYQGFPATLCVSVNDQVVHGIPSDRVLVEGDVVGLDFGVLYKDLVTDGAITVIIGEAPKEVRQLVNATRESLLTGIKAVKAGAHIGDISSVIEKSLRVGRYGIVEDLAGHGVGDSLHEDPWIPNFGKAGRGPILEAGMTIAIEPMATLGGKKVRVGHDGWTVATRDGSLAAHFEHTVLVTETGAEILTKVG